MARIRASCPSCGDVELTVADVQVRICSTTSEGEYAFRCPECSTIITKQAESRTIDLLVASGVRVSTWAMPQERLLSDHNRPITHDDVIDFHLLLNDDNLLQQALGTLADDR